MKVLITGFDAFNQATLNPSLEAVKLLDNQINGFEVIKRALPTKYYASFETLNNYFDKYQPDYVILVGQAAKRVGISLEYFAVNMYDAKIADNDGLILRHQLINEKGRVAYKTKFDLEVFSQALTQAKLDNYISYHAGTFVCNSTYYQLLEKINLEKLASKALFVHVPLIEQQLSDYPKNTYAMQLVEIKQALKVIIESLIK